MDKLVNHLQAMRRLRGYSQAQLADRLGIPFTQLSQWERGVRTPSLYWALRLADALVCRVEDLFSVPSNDCHT